MSLVESIDRDIVAAMKAREADKLSVLRMVKTSFKMKEIDKRAPLTDQEAQQILTTLIKQRRESIEAFTKGDRPELAAKEASEIVVIETYMPKAVGDAEIRPLVVQSIDEIASANGARPIAKDMGLVHESGTGQDPGSWPPRRWQAGERDREGGAGEGLARATAPPSRRAYTR